MNTLCLCVCRWVHNTVRGIDDEPVAPKDKVKSINSCKSFDSTSDLLAVATWLGVLCEELAERMSEDEEEHRRRAKSLGERCRARGAVRL